MGRRIKNLVAVFSDPKARAIVIIFFILALVAFFIAYIHFQRASVKGAPPAATLPAAPSGIRSIPGVGEPPITYQRLVELQNILQAQEAIRARTAAIPTPVRLTYAEDGAFLREDMTKAVGCSNEELKAAKAAGIPAITLRCRGCDIAALKNAGYTAKDLMAAGFNAKELRDAGFTPKDLKDAGFSATNLKDAGFVAKDLRDAGYSPRELKDAGFTAADLKNAGFIPKDLRDAGFSAQILQNTGLTPKDLRDAGFSAPELKDAGFTPDELTKAGFTKGEVEAIPMAITPTAVIPTPFEKPSWQDQMLEMRKKAAEQLSKQEYDDTVKQIQQNMMAQTNDLIASWIPIPQQQYAIGEVETPIEGAPKGTEAAALAAEAQGENYKAGTILFAVLDTGINSDEQSPILATVVQGKLKGAKLIGSFQRVEKKVVLQFNLLNVPYLDKSIPINAVAIDQNTARTALATKVDNHYLLRYGTLFAASFVSGLGQAIQTSGSSSTSNPNGQNEHFWPKLDAGEKALVALGYAGQQFGNVLSPIFNRPPTVEVKSGSGIGILIMADFPIQKMLKQGGLSRSVAKHGM